MATPREVIDLIERFERNRESYCSSAYNETETRREFIDPFFKALGWDIDNEQGYAEAYKDVVHEDAIKIGGARKFFVEAKLKLHKQLATAMTKNEKTALQYQINATNKQIDQLVCKLYGLTDEEIKIVEEAVQNRL